MSNVSCGDLLYMCCLLDFDGLSLLNCLTNLTIYIHGSRSFLIKYHL